MTVCVIMCINKHLAQINEKVTIPTFSMSSFVSMLSIHSLSDTKSFLYSQLK